ncbi:MAG: ABC transporter ATP-binding protein, partial [Mycobacterium sp.]
MAPDLGKAPETVVRLRGVSKRYGSLEAVSHLDLD